MLADFIDSTEEHAAYKFSSKSKSLIRKLIGEIRDSPVEADKITMSSDIVSPPDSKWMSKKIHHWISNTVPVNTYIYRSDKYTLRLIMYEPESSTTVNEHFKNMLAFLAIAETYSSRKCGHIVVNIWMTPFLKTDTVDSSSSRDIASSSRDNVSSSRGIASSSRGIASFSRGIASSSRGIASSPGIENVNSGFTYACSPESEICVYRKEEWFKVFIHETIHSFSLDATSYSTVDILGHRAVLLNETYCEMWAEIWYILFICGGKVENATTLLDIQRLFSAYQSEKVRNLGDEKQNVFAYYVAKALCMWRFNEFVDNLGDFSAPLNESRLQKFIYFLQETPNPNIRLTNETAELKKTLRMCIM